jgi:hypothetical protein
MFDRASLALGLLIGLSGVCEIGVREKKP